MNNLSITVVEETPKLLHGTIEATIFNASPYSPLLPFKVSSTNTYIYTNVISAVYIYKCSSWVFGLLLFAYKED